MEQRTMTTPAQQVKWWQRTYKGRAFESRMQGAVGVAALILFCGMPLGIHLVSSYKEKHRTKGTSDRKDVIYAEIQKRRFLRRETGFSNGVDDTSYQIGTGFSKVIPVTMISSNRRKKQEDNA
jgi:hypothetical protein